MNVPKHASHAFAHHFHARNVFFRDDSGRCDLTAMAKIRIHTAKSLIKVQTVRKSLTCKH